MRALSFLYGSAIALACFLLYTLLSPCPAAVPVPHPRAAARTASRITAAASPARSHFGKHHRHGAARSGSRDPGGAAAGKQSSVSQSPPEQQDLAALLRRAAMPDKTVLITAINRAWAAPGSGLDLFLESFREGDHIAHLINHLLIVSMDRDAFGRCKAVHPLCYLLRLDGLDVATEQVYMKGDYLEMMWRRNRFQQSILELGYSFLFTDVDILWFRDPFPRIPREAHLIMSADFFVGDPSSPGNYPNGGLLYTKSCGESVEFYRQWQAARSRFPGKHEQYVFDRLVKEGFPAGIGMKVQFLNTQYFGGFCQHGKDLGKICTMHANCCVGLENKLADLRSVLDDWKGYKAARMRGGDASSVSWRVPGRCIH